MTRVRISIALASALALTASSAHADHAAKMLLAKQMLGDAPDPMRPHTSHKHGTPTAALLSKPAPPLPKAAPPWWFQRDAAPRSAKVSPRDMWTESIEDASAPLRLSGTGEGSGTPAGTRYVAREVVTVGKGRADLDVDSYTHTGPGVSGEHLAHVAAAPAGRVPPDVIQRVVRDNFGRFQVCYDAGQQRHPGLEGRVAVKFVIDRRGSVALAADAGSDLPDPDVVSCVVRAFDSLTFPESKDSAVTVVYPIVFTAAPARTKP